jgi:hypothetical protein
MGGEYNHLGEVCESNKESKGEEICMGCYNSFRQSVFGHERQVERKKESLELEHPWGKNSRVCWSIFGAEDLRVKLSSLKSEILCELHCNNNFLLWFAGSFPNSEFP